MRLSWLSIIFERVLDRAGGRRGADAGWNQLTDYVDLDLLFILGLCLLSDGGALANSKRY